MSAVATVALIGAAFVTVGGYLNLLSLIYPDPSQIKNPDTRDRIRANKKIGPVLWRVGFVIIALALTAGLIGKWV